MKKHLYIVATILILFNLLFLLTSCHHDMSTELKDESKSQLYIYNYDGGIGTDWLREIKTKFEDKYADTSFENNKKGVQIFIQANKDFDSDNFVFSQSICQVAFCEKLTAAYFVNNNDLLDLTDVVNDIISQDGVSISDSVLSAMQFKEKDHYYAIPHYEGGGGLIYDKDLFNSKNFYIAKDGSYTNDSNEFSDGPDGISGTSDDGLPATYEEFFDLCAQMKRKGVTPFIIAGKYKYEYCSYILDRLSASYNGKDITNAYFSLSMDDYKYVTDMIENEDTLFGYDLVTQTSNLNVNNGYIAKQNAGNYYALSFLKEIIANKYYDEQGWASTREHLDAQEIYLKSSSSRNTDPIAMLIDGVWWSNEAKEVFSRMEKTNQKFSEMNRNFGWMPLPTKLNNSDTNKNGDPYLTLNSVCAYAIAKKDTTQEMQNLIKTFLKFCYTQENLEAFTVNTGMPRAINYNLSIENYNKLSSFKKEIWDIHTNGKFIYIHANNMLTSMKENTWFGERWKGESKYTNPISAFFRTSDVATGKEYFMDMWISDSTWKRVYSDYLES